MPTTGLPDRSFTGLPRQVQIEPVGQCNLRCAMCLIRFRGKQQVSDQGAFMQPDMFRNLIDQFSPATELHLQGLGEPFLHPFFFDMVSYAGRRGMSVSTNSNLTLLDSERADACVRSGLSWMRVSIDGATAKTYESIRAGARLDRVLHNLNLLQKAKKKLGSATPRLFLVMVAMRRNVRELPEIIRLANRYSVEQVFVQHLSSDVSGETAEHMLMRDFIERESLLHADPDLLLDIFSEARALASRLNIELRLPAIGTREQHPKGRQGRARCDWPWRSAYISYDGRAMPCCMVALPERMNFGSMAEEGVLPVWNSDEFRRFRARLASDDPPLICRSCSLYRGTF